MEEAETSPARTAGPLVSAMRGVSRPLQPLPARGGRGAGMWSIRATASGSQGPASPQGRRPSRVAKETVRASSHPGPLFQVNFLQKRASVLQDELTAYQSRRYGRPPVS